MPICITFGTKQYQNALDRLFKSANKYMYTLTFNVSSITELIKAYPKHFQSDRGFGWWLWKPYLINSVLNSMQEGDYLIYLDSTIEILKNPEILLEDYKSDIILFNNGQIHQEYCKTECYYEMGYNSPLNQLQANGAIQIYRKSDFSLMFTEEYFLWCTKLDLINDEHDKTIQNNKFKTHRHDQSILTNLAIGYEIPLFTSPCQWGMKENAYFNHHRQL
jgi:hypothetical protein